MVMIFTRITIFLEQNEALDKYNNNNNNSNRDRKKKWNKILWNKKKENVDFPGKMNEEKDKNRGE